MALCDECKLEFGMKVDALILEQSGELLIEPTGSCKHYDDAIKRGFISEKSRDTEIMNREQNGI